MEKIANLDNKNEVLEWLQDRNGLKFHAVSERLKADRDVILVAVREFGANLQYASEELRNDKEVVLSALSSWLGSLRHASANLRSDKEVVAIAIKKNQNNLQYASEEIKDDKDFILSLPVFTDGIRYASTRLRNDKDIALAIVRKEGMCLQFLGDEIRNDLDVVFEATKNYHISVTYAGDKLKQDIGIDGCIEYVERRLFTEELDRKLPEKKELKDPMSLRDCMTEQNNAASKTKSNKLKI
ncbi:TPA: DUF4116 domain-containing protein [Burkholderia vietnamiensis]|nr:DUF4116 domain-containing protein [Burkholderia vietnamiensis]